MEFVLLEDVYLGFIYSAVNKLRTDKAQNRFNNSFKKTRLNHSVYC